MAPVLDARLQEQGWTAQHSYDGSMYSYLREPLGLIAGFTYHGRAYVCEGAEWVFIGKFNTPEEAWTTLQAITPLYARVK